VTVDEPRQDAGEHAVLALAPQIRRIVGARLKDPDAVDDLVQETLARVIEARPRLDENALAPYAIATARNLANLQIRNDYRHRRHAHRLIDLRDPERPEEKVLMREEQTAVNLALQGLSVEDRRAVVAHEVMDQDTAALARASGSTPGGVAAQLARARAKLRVNYVLALRRMQPPTPRCRAVLVALSAGDRRRQHALGAGEHLLDCEHCAALSEPLLQRRRSLAALAPVPLLRGALAWITKQLRTPTGQAVAGVTGATVAAAVVVLVTSGSPPKPAPLTVAGKPVSPHIAARTRRYLGRQIKARNVRVQSVPSNEGFWIGSTGDRIWVELTGPGESRSHIETGDRVSFTGRVARNGDGFARRVGVTRSEGAAELKAEEEHIEVSQENVHTRQ
jgi:RNA polymerase sigma factor (sigma-70 family)